MYVPDNYDAFVAHEERKEEVDYKLPVCSDCKGEITEDYLYYIEDEIFCSDCMMKHYRKPVEDFMRE